MCAPLFNTNHNRKIMPHLQVAHTSHSLLLHIAVATLVVIATAVAAATTSQLQSRQLQSSPEFLSQIPPHAVELSKPSVLLSNGLTQSASSPSLASSSSSSSSLSGHSLDFGGVGGGSSLYKLPQSTLLQANNNNNKLSHSRQPERPCFGTNNRLSAPNNSDHHYQNLRDRYTDCTYVDGNLEITKLPENADLSFLQSIKEVTGYVLIALVNVERVKLHSLSIIRGQELFKTADGSEYSLMILQNNMRFLEMPALQDILVGSVGLTDNYNLCLIDTIAWDSIIDKSVFKVIKVSNDPQRPKPNCPRCHQACNEQCWSDSANMCQQMQAFACHESCSSKRCFGPQANQCCHSFCVGGCSGSSERECFACKNFNDDGECMQECPPISKYNPTLYQLEPNPKGRYAHGSKCVKKCPEHLLRDNGACVRKCPPNKRSQGDECINCIGPCPKECQGVEVVHSGNVDHLRNCTVIEGSISILDSSFSGYTEFTNSNYTVGTMHPPMNPDKLVALKTIREITGYLNIQANHPDFKSLSFLRNLEVIGGRQTSDVYALSIMKTSLVSLNLRALKRVKAGGILIEENKDLCFAETMNWNQINVTDRHIITIKNNRDLRRCREDSLTCHKECTAEGCSGPNQDECSACKNYRFEDYCVSNCSATQDLGLLSYRASERTCKRCHEECKDGCSSSDSKDCFACKNVKDGYRCVAQCPIHKYSARDGKCQDCDASCVNGCTGPSNKLGPYGCNHCGKSVMIQPRNTSIVECIPADKPCPDGYYQEYNHDHHLVKGSDISQNRLVCRKCHSRCKTCTGMGTHNSVCVCAKYVAGDQCEDVCPRDTFADERTRRCLKCSPECIGCRGPTDADCISCRAYRIYQGDIIPALEPLDMNKTKFNFMCTEKCPTNKPYRISGVGMLDPYCSEKLDALSEFEKSAWYNSTFMIFLVILFIVLVACFCIFYRCQLQQQDKTVKLAEHLAGYSDQEPLHPSNVRPNLAALRTIKETELSKDEKPLGSGFGGIVYRGRWTPEGQEFDDRPVAIKVLKDNGNPNMNKEFLEEAYTMSLANHKHLVKLLGVCMTPNHLILVTPLMVLGCLLDYVIKNENDDFKPKNILEWCKQIADGMAYLEKIRIVHRDLALRNVLLQTRNKAMITDFGLAKFLDVNESGYQSSEGRLPIKWLAPECLRDKIFTHKSDVWAFGITIWELLTRGRKPYEDIKTECVPEEVEKGKRLPQPRYVSADIYKELLACWFYKPEDRRNFEELKNNFVKFARDPYRYLMIGEDGVNCSDSPEHNYHNEITEVEHSNECFDDVESDIVSFPGDDGAEPMTPLTPGKKYFASEDQRSRFDFEMRHHSETDTNHSQQSIITRRITSIRGHPDRFVEEDSFSTASQNQKNASASDINNNRNAGIMRTNPRNYDGSCWSMQQPFSTNPRQNLSNFTVPTDVDDYLVPSPSNKEPDNFNRMPCRPPFYERKMISTAPNTPLIMKPPHSAGPFRVENEEYFVDRMTNHHSDSNKVVRRFGNHFFPDPDVLCNTNKQDDNIVVL